MIHSRRNFLTKTVTATLAATWSFPLTSTPLHLLSPTEPSSGLQGVQDAPYSDEKTWDPVARLFPRPSDFLQLEHGYFSHALAELTAYTASRMERMQQLTSYYMRREQEGHVETARGRLAAYFGWDKESIALTRNTTESLNIIIQGYPWQQGDEAVISNQDYGSMVEAFEQASERYGFKIRVVDLPLYPTSDDDVVESYMRAVSPRTRMVLLTHMINLTGQVLPLNKLLATIRGEFNNKVVLVVDAAHSVAHVPYDWSSCQADVVAGSMHKWLCCPVGIGFLRIHPERFSFFYPLMGDSRLPKTNIRRFEHQGTRPIHHIEAATRCLELQEKMGPLPDKAARLRYLQQTWTSPLRTSGSPYRLWTPEQPERSYAIATVSHEKYSPTRLSQLLWDQFKIFTVAVEHPVVNGVRITPHLSNSIGDITKLNSALSKLA